MDFAHSFVGTPVENTHRHFFHFITWFWESSLCWSYACDKWSTYGSVFFKTGWLSLLISSIKMLFMFMICRHEQANPHTLPFRLILCHASADIGILIKNRVQNKTLYKIIDIILQYSTSYCLRVANIRLNNRRWEQRIKLVRKAFWHYLPGVSVVKFLFYCHDTYTHPHRTHARRYVVEEVELQLSEKLKSMFPIK